MKQGIRDILVAVAATFVLAVPVAGAAPPADFSDPVVASSLSSPTAIAFLPDGRMLVTEKGGALKLVDGGAARR